MRVDRPVSGSYVITTNANGVLDYDLGSADCVDMMRSDGGGSSEESYCVLDELPGYYLTEILDGNSYIPTKFCPELKTLPIWERQRSRHLIGGLPSQMNLESWTRELSFEPDPVLRTYLLTGVAEGFRIVDNDADIPSYDCANYTSVLSGDAFEFIDKLVCAEIVDGKCVISDDTPQCIHALGAVPKADGGFRPITDCKRPELLSINKFMSATCRTISYKSVDDVCNLLTLGCYTATVDISSAYRSISVHPSHWTYQGVRWWIDEELICLKDTRICFGLKNAPYLFSQISNFGVWLDEVTHRRLITLTIFWSALIHMTSAKGRRWS